VALAAGSRLGPYEILSPLGAGGMGEVYRARDPRLARDVAIKVLPEDSHSDPERLRRFEQEAKAAGALNHPNLLAVYDVGTHDGSPYIVSELLEGEALRERLRGGELSPKKAVEVAIAIARGLSAAHAKGIVHRDLKPANVFVMTDGHVKILDFGLAKLLHREAAPIGDATASQPTGAGTVMGTPGYMSPEQIRGPAADHRSDIFSFGVVLHEMVSGRKPFRGESAADVMTAVLREDPPDLSESGAKPPPGLRRILRRCLEKRPDDRFHSAHDLALALEAVSFDSGPAAAAPAAVETRQRSSVAVLPFVSLSGDPDNDYFADGITEDVIAQLSKIAALRVTSRTSAMQFKKRQASLREIGERLGVSKVLDGSVRRAGNRVRIVAQLVDAATDAHLWTETYDRELSDVFALQSDVALNVAGSLRAVLSPVERERVGKRPTASMEAYNEYLLGRHQLNKRSDEGLRLAISHFERAIALDASYASAYAGLADAYCVAGAGYMAAPPPDAHLRAERAAERALELDPGLPEAYTSVGFARMYYQWNYTAAERALRQAIELNPSHVQALQWCAQTLSCQGRFDEALECVRRAAELDPLSVLIATEASWPLIYTGRYDEALVQLRKALTLDPGFALAHYNVGNCHDRKGMHEEAIVAAREAVRLSGRLAVMLASLGRNYALAGRRSEAEAILEELEERARHASNIAFPVAIVCDALSESSRALDWLERAYAQREPFAGFIFMERWMPFENSRPTPRFQALLARIEGRRP
jgi:serine/threonine protein kinase/tetratricopeptide (TPR) repeat protein